MAKFRVLTDSELYDGLLQHNDKMTRLHKEIQVLINNNSAGDKDLNGGEQDSKLLLQALNCSELKLSSLSINDLSISKLITTSQV